MKPIQTIILLMAACMWLACDTLPQETANTDLEVLIDRTDSVRNYPVAENILQPLGLQQNKWQGIRITLSTISDKDVNDHIVIALPNQSEWSGNIVERATQIRRFTGQVQRAIDTLRESPNCTHSIVYRTIAREANALSSSHATKKYLLVWSNLYENSGYLNFYRPSFIVQLKQAPNKVEQLMSKSMPLCNLAHVQLWLLYNPKSYTDNNRYMPIVGLYKHLFESHGNTVHIATEFLQP